MGAGGVGGYFGARLQQAGNEVAFVARGAHLDALKKNGLRLSSPLGDAQLEVQAIEDPAQVAAADVVLFAVKLWDTESAAERLRPAMGPATVVIPFQNGVESIGQLARVLGDAAVMGGAAYIAARIAEPGVIAQTGEFARLREKRVRDVAGLDVVKLAQRRDLAAGVRAGLRAVRGLWLLAGPGIGDGGVGVEGDLPVDPLGTGLRLGALTADWSVMTPRWW